MARDLPGSRAVAPDAAPRSELHVLVTLGALAGIAGFALFEAANNAQFTYIERFAVAEGYAAHSIGLALLCASLAGIPGAFTIVLLGQRFGTLAPLALGVAVSVTGLALLVLADGYPWYVASCCCMGFAWAFCLPYIQSLLASLDRNGSVVAAGTSASTLGSAVGPGLAALAVTGAGYVGVFLLAIAMFALAISSFAVSARHRRQAREILV
jgi:predicted MFS family arabinose efflux permease